ncbi:MAG: hypothetical protein GX240_06800 [Candidatus Atribacteria bacterium]|jgi:hypothetical protein|nr:hypothetical protein [Candidatus Atribacteria bacterium]
MKEIGTVDITDNSRLVLSVGEFRGKPRVDIRTYIKLKDKDEYVPTKKGINFSADWIDSFIEMVKKLDDAEFK